MTSMTRRSRTSPAAARRGERGVSILLAMLVLMILVVVVWEVFYAASVELDHARAATDRFRMEMLADAARQQAESVLLVDLEAAEESESGDEGGAEGAGGGGGLFGGDAGGGGAAGGGAAADEADVANVTATTDSRLDAWNSSAAMAPTLGEDLHVLVEVEDEDGKLNLLGIWTADEDRRQAQREILRSLLDHAFEGSSYDISFVDATGILDRLDDWARGNRGSFDPIPTPRRKKSNAEEEAGEDEASTGFTSDEKHFPFTLEELRMIQGFRPEHFSGFVEDDEHYPGLDRYLTLWSHLELKPEPKLDDDPFAGSPFGAKAGGPGGAGGAGGAAAAAGGAGASGSTGGAGGTGAGGTGAGDELTAEPTNEGFINANTAPLVVLRALGGDDIPLSFLEKVDEFRRRIDELRDDEDLSGGSLFSKPAKAEDDESAFGGDGEQDVTDYVFQSPQEIIDKVETEYGIELSVDPGVAEAFVAHFGVTSQVFTIKVLVYDLVENRSTGETEFGRRASFRTVVWRMKGSDRPRILTLQAFEPYHDTRRRQDYGRDFEELAFDQKDAYADAWAGR